MLRDFHWARQLSVHEIPLLPAKCNAQGDIELGNPPLKLPRRARAEFFLTHFAKVRDLVAAGGAAVCGPNGDAVFEFMGLRFEVTTSQTLSIIHEILYERTYDIQFPTAAVIVDVGMNVGVASLFFAHRGYRVHAFEPFEATCALASRNFALNPQFAQLITHRRIGLANRQEEIAAIYCPDAPGDCGMTPIPDAYRGGRAIVRERICVEPASDVIRGIAAQHPGCALIVKLDCEGAEVEIMASLCATGAIGSVGAFLIEWHRRASRNLPRSIEESLTDNGFAVVSRGWPEREVGMTYAIRIK